MTAVLTIRDQRLDLDQGDDTFELAFPDERITVRELIRERVYQEVDDHNRRTRAGHALDDRRALIAATGPREVDWRTQFDRAVRAYEMRRVLVLVGDRETQSLDEMIHITPGLEVTFLRLVMLAGG